MITGIFIFVYYIEFTDSYKNYKAKIEDKEHDKKTIQKYLYRWLKEYDEEFKQKFPSDR